MSLAFDIGANAGEMTQTLLRYYDRVIAFEPNPNLAAALRKRFSGRNVEVVQKAVSDTNTPKTFHICGAQNLSTLSDEWTTQSRFANDESWDIDIQVQTTTIDEAIEVYGKPDYIKIDVEGAEYSVIQGLSQLLDDTLISFEWVEEMPRTLFQCLDRLMEIGYSDFSVSYNHDDIQLPENIFFNTSHDVRKDLAEKIQDNRKELWGMIYAIKQAPECLKEITNEDIYAAFVNLDSRLDRLVRMLPELNKAGIKAERFNALMPHEVNQPYDKIAVMFNRTKGAIGCHFSQVAVMKKALDLGKHAFVMEDDLVFCSDFQERFDYIKKFLSTHEWDIFWLGGTYHIPARWHDLAHTNPDLKNCTCTIGKDVIPTDDPKIVQAFGCWSTYAYIVNVNSLPRILDLLDQNVYQSMGIDWLFIKLSPILKTFAYVPGCVKQYDNVSNIGSGITEFSVFSNLGDYWFQDTQKDFDYTKYKILTDGNS